MSLAHTGTTITAAFLASLVECVEALTVVLAVGSVRGWPAALTGAGAALGVLAAIVALLGPSLSRIPLHLLQLVVGALLLLFGLRWLRKAILRAAGLIPLHDEIDSLFVDDASFALAILLWLAAWLVVPRVSPVWQALLFAGGLVIGSTIVRAHQQAATAFLVMM